jgi:hypothetical protein
MVWKRLRVLLVLESGDRIGAEESERPVLGELVPQVLESDGSRDVAALPEQGDHLPEGADRTFPGDVVEEPPDRLAETVTVRPGVTHEPCHRLGGVCCDEPAGLASSRDVEFSVLEGRDDLFDVAGRRDDDHRLGGLERGGEEVRNGVGEELIALVQADEVGVAVRGHDASFGLRHRNVVHGLLRDRLA